MKTRWTTSRGITLIELLVVLAISGVILGIAYGMISRARSFWYVQQARVDAARSGWVALNRVCRDLRAGLPADAAGATGAWRGTDGGVSLAEAVAPERVGERNGERLRSTRVETDAIEFPMAAVIDSADVRRPGMLRYALKREGNRVVGLACARAVSGETLADARDKVISDQAVSLSLEYLNAAEQWRTGWDRDDGTPKAIRVTVGVLPRQFDESETVKYFSSVVWLPVGTRIAR